MSDIIRAHADLFTAMALRDAWRWHHADVDQAGEPYMGHLLRVAAFVADDPVAVVVALLHDALEDHGADILPGYMLDTYGAEVAVAVEALTHRPNEPYVEYVGRVLRSGPLVARRVKFADLIDNTTRLDALDVVTAARLRRKYEPALARLAEDGG